MDVEITNGMQQQDLNELHTAHKEVILMMQCYDTLREDYAKIEESESNQMKDDISYEENRLTEETISIFSKVVLGIHDCTDDLQLMISDSLFTNWGVMSDTMYPISQY